MNDTDTPQKPLTRRRVVQLAGATVTAPTFVNVATADTASGNVELETTATAPTDTTIEITVYEDTSGDGSADRQQSKTISDGTTTTEYDLLESTTAQGDTLWLEVALSTSDDAVTPSLDTATLTLPETTSTPQPTPDPIDSPDNPQTLGQIWDNPNAIFAASVLGIAGVGLWSKSLAFAAWAGFVAFIHLAITTDGFGLMEQIAYATLVLVFVGFAFKFYREELGGE